MTSGLNKAVTPFRIHRLLAASRSHPQVFAATRCRSTLAVPFKPLVSSTFGKRNSSSVKQRVQEVETLPPDILVDEEKSPFYDPEAFYPANPGDILEDKFELVAKLGWGTSSTVWLARDTTWTKQSESNKFVAIKICNCNIDEDEISHELDITIHLSSVASNHRGRDILGTAIASFGLYSPKGSEHQVLVFEPMREPFWLFRRHLIGEDKVTRPWLPLFKRYLQILLEGLDFLHSEGHIIHTDLKLDNVMFSFEDQSVIETFVQGQKQHPMARKKAGDRTIYRCHNDFGDIDGKEKLKKMIPQITDFGLAQRGDKPGPHIHPIQPNVCHAPEVLLGMGWSYSADIWNFGILIWELLAGHLLFQNVDPRLYSPEAHLAEMIALIGPVPPSLIQRERDMRHWKFSPRVRNVHGELCSSAAEYYGGPFFTDEGDFTRNDMVPYTRNLQSEMPECVPEEETERFLKFMRRMLAWIPEERATAKELKNDPWFDDDI